MSNSQIIDALKELKPPSNKSLPNYIISGMTQSLWQARYQLITAQANPEGAGFISVPTKGTASLLEKENTRAARWLMTIDGADGFTAMLNKELAGGERYPVLNAVLSIATGAISFGAGSLFTIGTTAIDLSKTHQGVQARVGDELWQLEEIGKVKTAFGGWKVVHVAAYFLVDPFRARTPTKGWLIHEERHQLTI